MVRIESAGHAVRAERQRVGLTLPEAAERLGWNKSRLSRYETNKTALSDDAICAIARALELEPEYLLLQCLKVRFPKLADTSRQPGALVSEIIAFMQTVKPRRR